MEAECALLMIMCSLSHHIIRNRYLFLRLILIIKNLSRLEIFL